MIAQLQLFLLHPRAMALNAAITKMPAGDPAVATTTLDVKYDGGQIRSR
jgi:hypothetical protein